MPKDNNPNKKPQNKFKKEYNNDNPYNKLELNKFHQIDKHQPVKIGKLLHKKKRDLERMLQYRKKQGLDIVEEKVEELQKIQGELQGRKKQYEKDKRKQFFIESKYKQIMNIQKRKVAKKLRQLKQAGNNQELKVWYKKLNYIKHFPKNLKYVSLFPTSELSQKAKEFQNKLMDDIELDLNQKREKMNSFEPEYKVKQEKQQQKSKVKVKGSKPSKKIDDFFLIDEEDQQNIVFQKDESDQDGLEEEDEQQ